MRNPKITHVLSTRLVSLCNIPYTRITSRNCEEHETIIIFIITLYSDTVISVFTG